MKKALLFLYCLVLINCSTPIQKQYQTLSGNAFGTTYNIIYEGETNENYQIQIDSIVSAMNQSLSTYNPLSDISRINNGDTTVVVDAAFREVFEKSLKIYNETDGYFDPTVGSLVNAWGFGPGNEIQDLDSTQVALLLENIGFSKVSLVQQKVLKENQDIYFDFNAIAKGYGIDLIGRYLASKNCRNYMIELGGEIRVRGKNSKGEVWKIGVEEPNVDGSRAIGKILSIDNQAMATSGNYRKFKTDSLGNRYVHTINPKTGFAYPSNLLSASVISNLDCADVDAYATAFMAMGYEKTQKFLSVKQNLWVHLIYVDADGAIKTFTSKELLVADR